MASLVHTAVCPATQRNDHRTFYLFQAFSVFMNLKVINLTPLLLLGRLAIAVIFGLILLFNVNHLSALKAIFFTVWPAY